jgi:FMN phosphatase YigB (HAD superfamily)
VAGVHLIVFDLVPALLSWGDGHSGAAPDIPEQAAEVLENLYPDFRMAAITDGDHTALQLRKVLEDADLDSFFEILGTSAEFGPTVSPRVVRRLGAMVGMNPGKVVVVTARPALADAMRRSRIAVVLLDGPAAITAVPEALAELRAGRLNP